MTDAFNAKSTAAEVLSGVRLTNKTFLVTGVSSGIGLEVARALGSRGANVVGTLRNLSTAEEAIRPIRDGVRNGGGSLELVELDLASLASVRAARNARGCQPARGGVCA